MGKYLKQNQDYWQRPYEGDNVESHVFRPYGRILKRDFGLTGGKGERMLDFGCGYGATLNFFKSKGFDVYGVDVSQININACQKRMPDIANHFMVIDAKPSTDDCWVGGGGMNLITAIDSLYYYTNSDLETRLTSFYRQMRPGAVIYATMIGIQSERYFRHSTPDIDGLRKVTFPSVNGDLSTHFINLTESESDLIRKFKIFQKKHVGFYSYRFREDEDVAFFYTFVGRKE
jgi:cyclopropane fatty-acyl-phospholipid synthase-like methyltransferase